MAVSPYFTHAAELFRKSAKLAESGFGVEVYGKGADHNDLLQLKKSTWRLEATDGEKIGYEGIEVHYESCRPGHFVIHCELWPRLGKKEKALAVGIADLLELKGGITKLIRERGLEEGWEQAHRAHLRRAREDPRDPSSLIVYTFDTGLPEGHGPEEFVSKVLPIIDATAPVIDEILIESPKK